MEPSLRKGPPVNAPDDMHAAAMALMNGTDLEKLHRRVVESVELLGFRYPAGSDFFVILQAAKFVLLRPQASECRIAEKLGLSDVTAA